MPLGDKTRSVARTGRYEGVVRGKNSDEREEVTRRYLNRELEGRIALVTSETEKTSREAIAPSGYKRWPVLGSRRGCLNGVVVPAERGK